MSAFVRDMLALEAAIHAAPSLAERRRLEDKRAQYLVAHDRGDSVEPFRVEAAE